MSSSNNKNIDQKSDIELISYYKQSDDLEVLGILYNRYVHLVYGVSLKYLKNPDESQDAAMQVLNDAQNALFQASNVEGAMEEAKQDIINNKQKVYDPNKTK